MFLNYEYARYELGNNYRMPAGGLFISILDLAKKIYERHTILTKMLTNIGVAPDVAAHDACKMEHVISDETLNAIKKHIGA